MFKNFTKYEVYDDGRIWSYSRNKFLKPWANKDGYQRVELSDNEGKIKTYLVHRVVYESVTGEPIPDYLDCNHIDEDKTNCSFANLNLMTRKENINWGGSGIKRRAKTQSKVLTNNPKISKQVGAFQNGELVMIFPSTREAHRQGFDSSAVGKCCNGKLPHYKGYEWKYI